MCSTQRCAPLKYSWLPVTYTRASRARTSPSGSACCRGRPPRRRRCRRCAPRCPRPAVDHLGHAARPARPGRSARSACRSAGPPAARPGRDPGRGIVTSAPVPDRAQRPARAPEQQHQRDQRDHRSAQRERAGSATPASARTSRSTRRAWTRRTAPRPRRARGHPRRRPSRHRGRGRAAAPSGGRRPARPAARSARRSARSASRARSTRPPRPACSSSHQERNVHIISAPPSNRLPDHRRHLGHHSIMRRDRQDARMGGDETFLDRARQLTTEQKAALCLGGDIWHTAAIARARHRRDHALRRPARPAPATRRRRPRRGGRQPAGHLLPDRLRAGSTWDAELAREIGDALGVEARAQDVAVVLGPGSTSSARRCAGATSSTCPRTRYLAGRLGAAMVRGHPGRGRRRLGRSTSRRTTRRPTGCGSAPTSTSARCARSTCPPSSTSSPTPRRGR